MCQGKREPLRSKEGNDGGGAAAITACVYAGVAFKRIILLFRA